jgi:hypothetical protein
MTSQYLVCSPRCLTEVVLGTVFRFDLVLVSNGRKEKLASGLLKPFLAHLKVAQDQIAKGGYSVTLEPSSGFDAPWFTRGTVERLVPIISAPTRDIPVWGIHM